MDTTIIEQAAQAYAKYGWLGFSGVLLTGVVGFYKSPLLQKILPAAMRWQNIHPLLRMTVVFLFSLAGFGIALYLSTNSWIAAISGGIQAALVAMGGKSVLDVISSTTDSSGNWADKPTISKPERGSIAIERASIQTRLETKNAGPLK